MHVGGCPPLLITTMIAFTSRTPSFLLKEELLNTRDIGGHNGKHSGGLMSTYHCVPKDEDKTDGDLEWKIVEGDSVLSESMPTLPNLAMALDISQGGCLTAMSFYYEKTLVVHDSISGSFTTDRPQAAETYSVLHHPYNEWSHQSSLKDSAVSQHDQASYPAVTEVVCSSVFVDGFLWAACASSNFEEEDNEYVDIECFVKYGGAVKSLTPTSSVSPAKSRQPLLPTTSPTLQTQSPINFQLSSHVDEEIKSVFPGTSASTGALMPPTIYHTIRPTLLDNTPGKANQLFWHHSTDKSGATQWTEPRSSRKIQAFMILTQLEDDASCPALLMLVHGRTLTGRCLFCVARARCDPIMVFTWDHDAGVVAFLASLLESIGASWEGFKSVALRPCGDDVSVSCRKIDNVGSHAGGLHIYNGICDTCFTLSNCDELELEHRALDDELLAVPCTFVTVLAGLLFASVVVGLCSSVVYCFSKHAEIQVKVLLFFILAVRGIVRFAS